MHNPTSRYVFDLPSAPVVPVAGTDLLFPVRRVYCVGRNYGAHAVEMGHDPNREEPFFFQKNRESLVLDGKFPYPPATSDVHHEIELVIGLKAGGSDIPAATALDCIFGYAVGLDMTRRDLQAKAKDAGRPWEAGKAFEASAPIAAIAPATAVGHPTTGLIWLDVNGARRQTGDLAQMIWKVPEIISTLSTLFTLAAGDLIFTGTPSGVGPVQRGDRLHGHIDGVGEIEVKVV